MRGVTDSLMQDTCLPQFCVCVCVCMCLCVCVCAAAGMLGKLFLRAVLRLVNT
jgi:hypothetical protein